MPLIHIMVWESKVGVRYSALGWALDQITLLGAFWQEARALLIVEFSCQKIETEHCKSIEIQDNTAARVIIMPILRI
jgi:hypothetical protein